MILTIEADHAAWLDGVDVVEIQKPAPDDLLRIVATGSRSDSLLDQAALI